LSIIQGSSGALHFFQDVARLGGPNKWLGILVVAVDVISNGHDQLLDIAEDVTDSAVMQDIQSPSKLIRVDPA
jgi:hypothetical protein